MAIHIFGDAKYEGNPIVEELALCFYCGKPIHQFNVNAGGFVYWTGNPEAIALHQPCAELLAIKLIGDAQKLVSKTGIRVKLREGEMVNYSSDLNMTF